MGASRIREGEGEQDSDFVRSNSEFEVNPYLNEQFDPQRITIKKRTFDELDHLDVHFTAESPHKRMRLKAKSDIPCIYFQQGRCRNGDACPFQHLLVKEDGKEASSERVA